MRQPASSKILARPSSYCFEAEELRTLNGIYDKTGGLLICGLLIVRIIRLTTGVFEVSLGARSVRPSTPILPSQARSRVMFYVQCDLTVYTVPQLWTK